MLSRDSIKSELFLCEIPRKKSLSTESRTKNAIDQAESRIQRTKNTIENSTV